MKGHLAEGGVVFIHCPGCRSFHSVSTQVRNSSGAMWQWNGSLELPTFTPSLNVFWSYNRSDGTRIDHRCHSFITAGKIQFLMGSTHELAGQTVDLLEWDTGDD